MKRFWYLAVLMVVSSSAHAGSSFSFVVGGHHIHIEAPSHCNSASCVSVSIPGIYESRRRDSYRDRDDDIDTTDTPAPAAEQAAARPAVASAVTPACPAVAPVASVPAAPIAAQPAPAPRPAIARPGIPSVGFSAADVPPATKAPPVTTGVSHEVEDEPEPTPIGDWQTEGKTGSVRIQACGNALCGYVLETSSNTVGESVLINMKPKTASEWSGNVYSHGSGDTYYGTIAMNGTNSLRVEACALGHFFCSSNLWSRIDGKPGRLISSR
jgi:uncharacterized protein (DUF2147 family)